MGVDVVFNAVFPTPKSAAARFSEVWNLLSIRPEFRGPERVRAYELIDEANPVAVVEGDASEPAVASQLRELIAEYAADKYSFVGTWGITGMRSGHRTRYSVEVTARSLLTRHDPSFKRDIDVTWNLGDSRRYTPEGKNDYPNAKQLIADLQVLIELGARSVWGSTERIVNPLELYAVYHRDPNDYRNDGLPAPLPKLSIDDAHVEVAAETAREAYEEHDKLQLFATNAGSIVYSPLLVRGTLNTFYTYLDRVLKTDIQSDLKATGAAGYRAYEYSENQQKWIVVERRADEAPIVRIESLEQEGDTLAIAYEIVEPGIDDSIIRALVPLTVLRGLYGNIYQGSVAQLCYRNRASGTEDLVPY